MIIRAGEQHVPAIVDLWKQLSDYQAGFDPVHKIKDDAGIKFAEYLRSKLSSEEDLFLVAIVDKKVVGFSMSAVRKGRLDVYDRALIAEISDMFVLKENRWQGIGTEMLDHIHRWIKSKNIERIELNVEARNNIGIAFWRKHGFKNFINRLYLEC